MDSITSILKNLGDENVFVTAARKDNFRYIWDRRNMSCFVKCLQYQSYSNQRIGITWYEDGEGVLSGSEFGLLLSWNNVTTNHNNYIKAQ